MIPEWNWNQFFQTEFTAPFRLETTADCVRLVPLSFDVGLQVLIESIPALTSVQWRPLEAYLLSLSTTKKVQMWCEIGQSMIDLRDDVRQVVHYHSVAQALAIADDALQADNLCAQVAFMACLYHERQTQVKARMLFTYLLQHHDSVDYQLQRVRQFLLNLTPRQRETAVWVGRGYTNPEIAHALTIKRETVAEYLTHIYADFAETLNIDTDTHGLRYRLIYWLTRLFERYPDLLIG